MKIYITGVAGFIGFHLAKKLIASGHDVYRIDNLNSYYSKKLKFKRLQILKKKVEENKFGNIGIVDINVFWQRPQSYYDKDEWRGTKELDGGALLNQASHYVDLLEWIIGPLEGLYANVSTISSSNLFFKNLFCELGIFLIEK